MLKRCIAVASIGLIGCGGDKGPTEADGLNLRIETMYLVQSVQTRDGTVPLVAGKDAYLRVFVVANKANTLAPTVRVQLLKNGVPTETLTIPATGSSVPTGVDQSSLANSWNVKIPAATIQPGLQILAEVDPADEVDETNEQDNQFPVSASPQALQITALQPFRIRFVPIVQASNGSTGNVDESNIESYLTFTRKIHPVSTIDADLRVPYTVNGLGFDPQGNTWQTAVSELDAVQKSEGSDRFYYGVVNTDYDGGGVVGIAAGIPANAALGWDRFPDAPITVAHEIGHDWGRRHAPCGGAGGADPSYPYSLGLIGAYGLDLATMELMTPSGNTDIMGYCNVKFWISDYTYTGIFNYRVANPLASIRPKVPALMVWGRIENGIPKLEPAFQVTAPPFLPEEPGPYRIEALDASGREVFAYSFAAEATPDVPGDFRHFAFAVPVSQSDVDRITTLRLISRGREARVVAGENPLTVVRDEKSGAILSLVRGTRAPGFANARNVRLDFSDGIKNRR
jgi:hypothetical protein